MLQIEIDVILREVSITKRGRLLEVIGLVFQGYTCALIAYTLTRLIRVYQFPRAVRVMLQLNKGEVGVFLMYCW